MPNIDFVSFRDEVVPRMDGSSCKVRREIGSALRRFSKIPGANAKIQDSEWTEWLHEVELSDDPRDYAWSGKKKTPEGMTNFVTKLQNPGSGSPKTAAALYYRLHYHVEDLSYAHDVDRKAFNGEIFDDRNDGKPVFEERQEAVWSEDSISPVLSLDVIESGLHFSRQVSNVVGRSKELQDLRYFLDTGGSKFSWLQLAGIGGQGKSRLAFELAQERIDGGQWTAGFLAGNKLEKFSFDVEKWQPDNPTLIIIDYVIGSEFHVRPIIQNLANRGDDPSHPIRLLLVERQRWDRGGLIKMEIVSPSSPPSDYAFDASEGVASWFLSLCDRKHDGLDSAISRSRYTKNNGVVELKGLAPESLVRIIRDAAGKSKIVESTTDEAIRATLENIDKSGRPLYCLLLAQALTEGFYKEGWTRQDLLEQVLARERETRWRLAFGDRTPKISENKLSNKISVLATMLGGFANSDNATPEAWGAIELRDIEEACVLSDAPVGTRQTLKHFVPALQPDILGEYFVLASLDAGFIDLEELCSTAWLVSPEAMGAFVARCVDDFSTHPVTQQLLEHIPQEYAWVLHSLAIQFHPANVGKSGKMISSISYMGNTNWTIGSMQLADDKVSDREQKSKQAAFWYQKAIQLGSIPSHYNLANLYWNGEGVEGDQLHAIQLYKKAAELGHAPSMEVLGDLYRNGIHHDTDCAAAAYWYERAAKDEQIESAYQLGLLFEAGLGIDQNSRMSFEYTSMAAEKGHTSALVELGWKYLHGDGAMQNEGEAVSCFAKAAKRKSDDALLGLAECYGNGFGVEKNHSRSAALNRLAVKWGNELAAIIHEAPVLARGAMFEGPLPLDAHR